MSNNLIFVIARRNDEAIANIIRIASLRLPRYARNDTLFYLFYFQAKTSKPISLFAPPAIYIL
jgi:hypothetical protein